MKSTHLIAWTLQSLVALVVGLALAPHGAAEDINLYAGVNGAGAPANVLIILDNSSNWSANNQNWPTDTNPPVACGTACDKQGYYELKAIRTVVNGLPTSASLNLGLMLFNNSNASRDGGYVRFHVRPLNATNKTAFLNKLDEIIQNFNTEGTGSSVQYGAILFDAFKYYGGFTNPASSPAAPPSNPTYDAIPVFGNRFWGSNNVDGSKPDAAAYDDDEYEAISQVLCGRNFIVFVGNGFPAREDTTPDMGAVLKLLTNPDSPPATIDEFPLSTTSTSQTCTFANTCYADATACNAAKPVDTSTNTYTCVKDTCSGNARKIQTCTSTTTTAYAQPSGNAVARYADEFADFLYKTDVTNDADQLPQNITLYAIDVYKDHQDTDQTALMQNMAKYGGGKYFAARNESELNQAFDSVLSEILSINSAFASASLPVSVNTQGTYLNQIFIGLFRPDSTRKPRWAGNLKQYQFVLGTDKTLQLGDKNGNPAISATTGFIAPCAVSFWTPTTQDSYWDLQPSGACTTSGAKASNSPDGEVVEKGGAAYHLRAISPPADRVVKTCADSTCSTGLISFNSSATAQTSLSSDLINWARGLNLDAEIVNPDTTAMRPSSHGDVLHSRPLAIDFGTASIPDVKVFYGGNDGMLRAVNADQADSEGTELWSFVAPEHWPQFSRLRANDPLLRFQQSDGTYTDGSPKDYAFDGAIGSYINGTTKWIYPTMRRGGRVLYAFDVSTPSSPSLLWRKGCPNQSNDTGCSTGWSGIGQTWSMPKAIFVSGYTDIASQPKPLLIVGGGYDTCEDNEPANCSSPKGARIYVIDAEDGTLLKELALPTGGRSVVADITPVYSSVDYDDKADLAYAVDTGGNLYRINIGTDQPADWTLTKIASLGCNGNNNANCPQNSGLPLKRKFLYAPEVVVTTGYNAILVGSGDREHPLSINLASTVNNAFFMIKDIPTNASWLTTSNCNSENVICTNDLYTIDPATTAVPSAADLAAKKGWYLNFGTGNFDQEQVVTSAIVVGGFAYFSTHRPVSNTSNTCSDNLGTARAYAVSFLDAQAMAGETRYDTFAGGGLPPSPVTGLVSVLDTTTNETVTVPFIIGGKSAGAGNATTSGLQGQLPNIPISTKRTRIYWYIEK